MLSKIVTGYLACALWSSTEGDMPLDEKFSVYDFAFSARDKAIADCKAFVDKVGLSLLGSYVDQFHGGDWEQVGHDFWLTRNGHGAGFWDGDWGEVGDLLTEIAGDFGEVYVYSDGAGKLHFGG